MWKRTMLHGYAGYAGHDVQSTAQMQDENSMKNGLMV